MHLFSGEVEELQNTPGDIANDYPRWEGEVLIMIKEVIDLINFNKPFPETMKEYYSVQLNKMKETLN